MFESNQIELWQRRKQVCFGLVKVAGILLVLCLAARLVPVINDWLSGPAEPMRAIAQQLAKASATATAQQYPIIVTRAENLSCQNAQHTTSTDYDAVLYVITYSEKSRSLCLTTYLHFPTGTPLPNATVLSESMGHNYGPPLSAPLKAVPMENRLTSYPEQYLSLLHWRTKVAFPLAHADLLRAHTRQFAPNGDVASMGLDLGFQDLRNAVAERHNAVNHVLSVVLFSGLLLLIALTAFLWMVFWRVQQYCRSYDFVVSPLMFLLENLTTVEGKARRQYLVRQQEIQDRFRAVNALKHSTEEARDRLQCLLENVPDENVRAEISSCLERGQLEEMNTAFQRYQAQAGQKTPEDRLSLLLESLKPYCASEEFEDCREEAFALLQQSGFRQAREFVVKMHDELRDRFKKSTEDTSPEDLENTA